MMSAAPTKKKFKRLCAICLRSSTDESKLGPFINLASISAHYLCVRFSPVTPEKDEIVDEPNTGTSMAGVTCRFIRMEGARAKKLVRIICLSFLNISINLQLITFFPSLSKTQICNYCKAGGANSGCCFDIGSDEAIKFCKKKYHIDCGISAGAVFSVSKGRGVVSICYDHRDPIER